jgi:hypothetical protein
LTSGSSLICGTISWSGKGGFAGGDACAPDLQESKPSAIMAAL